MIEFMKFKELGDIDKWILQQAVDHTQVRHEYDECWQAINSDWSEHDIQRDGHGYAIAVQVGYIQMGKDGSSPYVYRMVLIPDVMPSRRHGIYFVADENLKVTTCMLSRPDVEDHVDTHSRPMN